MIAEKVTAIVSLVSFAGAGALAQADITSAGDWAQYGLAGLVIFALFTGFYSFLRTFLTRADKHLRATTEGHAEERREWAVRMDAAQEIHRAERTEWRESAERNCDKLDKALCRISDAVDRRS